MKLKIPTDIAIERAKRLKQTRLIANLNRNEFAALLEVSPTTISLWENITHSGLSEEGAYRTSRALRKININCSAEWLLFGNGEPPKFNNLCQNGEQINQYQDKEISIFKSFPNSIITKINDNSMFPAFLKGDVVGGIMEDIQLDKINDSDSYIIEYNGNYIVRKVQVSKKDSDIVTLSCLTLINNTDIIYRIENCLIYKIAKISRLWRD